MLAALPELHYSKINSAKKLPLPGIRPVTLALLLQSHAFPTEPSWQVLIEKYLTPLLFVHQLVFGPRGFS